MEMETMDTEATDPAPVAELTPTGRSPSKTDIPWDKIEHDLQHGMSMPEAARRYDVKYDTIKKHVKLNHIVIPSRQLQRNVERNLHKVVEAALEKVADKWAEKGENHRKVAFDVAHASVKKFKAKAPRNFRELEAADKIARRAAGLETADVVQQTLINVNEAIDNFDEPREVKEATVVETPHQLPAPQEAA
jgi:hypothetical protein